MLLRNLHSIIKFCILCEPPRQRLMGGHRIKWGHNHFQISSDVTALADRQLGFLKLKMFIAGALERRILHHLVNIASRG